MFLFALSSASSETAQTFCTLSRVFTLRRRFFLPLADVQHDSMASDNASISAEKRKAALPLRPIATPTSPAMFRSGSSKCSGRLTDLSGRPMATSLTQPYRARASRPHSSGLPRATTAEHLAAPKRPQVNTCPVRAFAFASILSTRARSARVTAAEPTGPLNVFVP